VDYDEAEEMEMMELSCQRYRDATTVMRDDYLVQNDEML
jgi:hypothetical protein